MAMTLLFLNTVMTLAIRLVHTVNAQKSFAEWMSSNVGAHLKFLYYYFILLFEKTLSL